MENDLVFIIDQAGRYYGTPYLEGQPNIHSVYYRTLCDRALEIDQYREWAALLKIRIENFDDSMTIPNMASKLGLITGWNLWLEPEPEEQVLLAIFPNKPRMA